MDFTNFIKEQAEEINNLIRIAYQSGYDQGYQNGRNDLKQELENEGELSDWQVEKLKQKNKSKKAMLKNEKRNSRNFK